MRPKIVSIPRERPYCCAECPLCGRRPVVELLKGDKFTLRCMMPEIDRVISGRGSKQPEARFRCRPKQWSKMFATYAGDVPVSASDYERYQLGRDAWLFQRDIRLNNNGETTETVHRQTDGGTETK